MLRNCFLGTLLSLIAACASQKHAGDSPQSHPLPVGKWQIQNPPEAQMPPLGPQALTLEIGNDVITVGGLCKDPSRPDRLMPILASSKIKWDANGGILEILDSSHQVVKAKTLLKGGKFPMYKEEECKVSLGQGFLRVHVLSKEDIELTPIEKSMRLHRAGTY